MTSSTEPSDGLLYGDPFVRRHLTRLKRIGRKQGYSEAILLVLHTRDLDVNEAEWERIIISTDLRQLKKWLRRAVTAEKASDLFD